MVLVKPANALVSALKLASKSANNANSPYHMQAATFIHWPGTQIPLVLQIVPVFPTAFATVGRKNANICRYVISATVTGTASVQPHGPASLSYPLVLPLPPASSSSSCCTGGWPTNTVPHHMDITVTGKDRCDNWINNALSLKLFNFHLSKYYHRAAIIWLWLLVGLV